MKTQIDMMNSMVRKTRLARAVVLLGVGLLVGTVSSWAEEVLFQKIIDWSITDFVSSSDYYRFQRDRLVELGSVNLSSGEELKYKTHFIQTEKLDSTINNELKDFTPTDNNWTGVILLTVKFPEFSQPLEIAYNRQENNGNNK